MKKSLMALIILVLGVMLLTGCGGGGNELLGTWAHNDEKCTFNRDGSVVFDLSGVVVEGTYEVNGDDITVFLMGDDEEVTLTDNPNEIRMGGRIYTKE